MTIVMITDAQCHDLSKRISNPFSFVQSKVQQLYQIDKLMQEESGTLQALQRDKENLEKALATLKTHVLNREGGNMPMAMDTARQQQHTLERELTRVHQLLAANSKVNYTENEKKSV